MAGNATGQFIDILIDPTADFSGNDLFFATLGGSIGEGLGALVPDSAGNFVVGLLPNNIGGKQFSTTLKGLSTRLENGSIKNVKAEIGAKSAVLDLTKESPEKAAVILGNILADVAKDQSCTKYNNRNCED